MLVPDLRKVTLQDSERKKRLIGQNRKCPEVQLRKVFYILFLFSHLKLLVCISYGLLCTYEAGRITSRTDSHAGWRTDQGTADRAAVRLH